MKCTVYRGWFLTDNIGHVFHHTLLRDSRRKRNNQSSGAYKAGLPINFTEFQDFSFPCHILPCLHRQLNSIPVITVFVVEDKQNTGSCTDIQAVYKLTALDGSGEWVIENTKYNDSTVAAADVKLSLSWPYSLKKYQIPNNKGESQETSRLKIQGLCDNTACHKDTISATHRRGIQ